MLSVLLSHTFAVVPRSASFALSVVLAGAMMSSSSASAT